MQMPNPLRTAMACLPVLLGTLACQPPEISVPMAPMPSPTQVKARSEAQSRVLPIPKTQVFPRVLEVLMEMGFQIRCVNEAQGQINIFQAWDDLRYASDPHFSMEATLLFLDAGSGSTRVRMTGIGYWNKWVYGNHLATTAQGTMPSFSSEDCREFLDRLQVQLCAKP